MSEKTSENRTDMDRREFLTTTAAVGGAMVLGFWMPPGAQAANVPVAPTPWYREATVPEINAWITIAPDDTVTIRVGQTELGTGVFTANPMMIAEELQCDWKKVRAEYASANRDAREKAPEWTLKVPGNGETDPAGAAPVELANANGVYRRMIIHSSGNVRESRYYLQLAGAEARERLLLAAATNGVCRCRSWWQSTASSRMRSRNAEPRMERLQPKPPEHRCPIHQRSKSRLPTNTRYSEPNRRASIPR